jgi:hypothetical protein
MVWRGNYRGKFIYNAAIVRVIVAYFAIASCGLFG